MTTFNRPRPVSDLVPGLTKDVFGRKSILFGKMMSQWKDIAGADIAAQTLPMDLKFSKKNANNQAVLHLSVQSAYALELSHQKNLLIERLNMFFGYPAIKDIKIIQNSEVMNKKNPKAPKTRLVTLQEEARIDEMVGTIQENDLQTALKNLGKAILSRQEKNS